MTKTKTKNKKKQKKVIVISRKKSKRDLSNSSPDNKVLVPDRIFDGLKAVSTYRASQRSSDGYSPEVNAGYAVKLGYHETAEWIMNNRNDYIDGIAIGFITEDRLVEYKSSHEIYEKYSGDLKELREEFKKSNGNSSKGRDLILNTLMTYRFIHREKLIGLLIANGVSRKFESARKYLNRILTGLRKEGYLIIKQKNYYSVKGVTEEVAKNGNSSKPEKEEEEMAKRKGKKTTSKKKAEPKKKDTAPRKAKKSASKKPSNGIVGFVIKKLESGEYTKRQLAQEILKSGLSTMKDEAAVVKYLNVTFFKWRKRGMPLKKKEKPKESGGTVGFFRLEKK